MIKYFFVIIRHTINISSIFYRCSLTLQYSFRCIIISTTGKDRIDERAEFQFQLHHNPVLQM